MLGAELPNGATFQVLKAKGMEAVRQVPRDQAAKPLVAADKPPAKEVFVVAPEARGGRVQLRRNDTTVAAAPLDNEGHAAIRGSVAVRAQRNAFTYRILDRHGREISRGSVTTRLDSVGPLRRCVEPRGPGWQRLSAARRRATQVGEYRILLPGGTRHAQARFRSTRP